MCGSVALGLPAYIAVQSWEEGIECWVSFDDEKIFKKVVEGACNFGNMVYSISSYR